MKTLFIALFCMLGGLVENMAGQVVPKAKDAPVAGQLPLEVLRAVVTISGGQGAGTGFICNFRGKPFVATNQHVLGVGNPFMIRTSNGAMLRPQQFFAAGDADITLIECTAVPTDITPLTLATMPDPVINQGNALIIAGNSKGDGVITQTLGKLLALGPQRVEVDNPVYHGNSGSPIIDLSTNKVVGVLTEAEAVALTPLEKASFRSGNSTIKSDTRYFGHRIDSVQKWEPLNWQQFQENEALIKLSRKELDDIVAFLTNSSDRYKDFAELHVARNNAATVFHDRKRSVEDKAEAFGRFMRDIEALARRASIRFDSRKVYFCQQNDVETISKFSAFIARGTVVAKRDNELAVTLIQRGN